MEYEGKASVDRAYAGQMASAQDRFAAEVRAQTRYTPSGSGSGGMVGICGDEQVCEDRGDLEHIVRRINECIDRASSNAERVSMLADRIKGTTPDKAMDSAKMGSAGNGAIADIHARIDVLMNALGTTGSGIARIERL